MLSSYILYGFVYRKQQEMKKAASLADKQSNSGPIGAKKKKRKLSLLQAGGVSGVSTTENSAESTTPPDGTSPAKIAKKEGSTEEQKPATATTIPGYHF